MTVLLPAAPAYCVHCGNPLPWTAAVIEQAEELIDLIDDLTPEQKQTLKSCMPSLITDTPAAPLAAVKTGKLMSRVEPHFREAFKQIVYSLMAAKIQGILQGFHF